MREKNLSLIAVSNLSLIVLEIFFLWVERECKCESGCVCEREFVSAEFCGPVERIDNTLQHTATHCNTLQHTATQCNPLQHTATLCNTLQHTATLCNTLQPSATHCNTHVLQPYTHSVLQGCVAVEHLDVPDDTSRMDIGMTHLKLQWMKLGRLI